MKTLYIDCGMGAAGDMLTAALVELTGDRDAATAKLNALGIPGVHFEAENSVKCGITGTHMRVLVNGEEEESHDHHHHHDHHREHEHHHHDHDHDHDHDHHHDHGHEHHHHHHDHAHDHGHEHHHSHNGMHEIEHIISHINASDNVKKSVEDVYRLIAEAESKAHNQPVDNVHFHEVGAMDAVADVAAVCTLIEMIGPDRIVASPIHVGAGSVKCAHGILPVPAPATAHILKGVPTYGGAIDGELCTPTGAALIKHFADEFGSMPEMIVDEIGYGMGMKDFEAANCVRMMLGENKIEDGIDYIYKLECNIDDMTAEDYAFATEKLLAAGALDVYTTSIMMKKMRPGFMLTVLASEADRERMASEIFRHTTTIGIREEKVRRYVLDRKNVTYSTSRGEVRAKEVSGYGTSRRKLEFDDVAKLAEAGESSIREVRESLSKELN